MIKQDSLFTVVYTSDVSITKKFWEKIGVVITQTEKEKVVINLGGFEIHYVLESTEPFDNYKFATQQEGRGQGNLYYFGVEEIENFYGLVKDQKPFKLTPIQNNHWGAKEFLFCDPNGYLFVAYE